MLDADGDGYEAPLDCDDADPEVNPGASEVCGDGIDNDCDGVASGCRMEGEEVINDVSDTIFQGSSTNDAFGTTVASGGDVNGDGTPDLLISQTSGGSSSPGSVHLFHSPTSGLVNAGAADASLHGIIQSDGLGMGITALGDMDGDGYGDFALGAPMAPQNTSGEEADWAVYVLTGPMTGDASVTTAEAWFPAVETTDLTGMRMGSPGDVSGDGVVDLLVASPSGSVGPGDLVGKVYLLEGDWNREEDLTEARAIFTGETAGSRVGSGAATSAGDVDGDGRNDLLITSAEVPVSGSPNTGAAYVVTSSANGQIDLRYADTRIYGLTAGDRFGASATSAGDVNADGYDDVLVGAPDSDLGALDAGAAYLFHGGSGLNGPMDAGDADFILLGAQSYGETGIAVSSVGDMDGDGNADFAVSDPTGIDASRLGVVGISYGPVAGNTDIEDADFLLIADDIDIQLGASLANPGDTDGDGLGEVLVGAPFLSPSGAPAAGGAYLVRGSGL
ncbi:MAG: hypothetical protein CL927_18165 [Deltaproteobacteria bacterium]|nr:hypothetical protein [Deltaproteobacteria bacterium]